MIDHVSTNSSAGLWGADAAQGRFWLASLDEELRTRVLTYLKRVRDEFRVPMLYVSHARREVVELCEEVLVLDRGVLKGQGDPGELLTRLPQDAVYSPSA